MTIIPLTNQTHQVFSVDLEGQIYRLTVEWNERLQLWSMNISDNDGIVLIYGIALVKGTEILEPYNLGVGGIVMVDTETDGPDATVDDLGTRILMAHLTEAELEDGEAIPTAV